MKTLFTFILLIPLASYAQRGIVLVNASSSIGSDLQGSYGAGITVGARIYPSGYLAFSTELKYYSVLPRPLVPMAIGILYAPHQNMPISPIGQIQLGYSLYSNAQKSGWFYTGMFLGAKANERFSPFIVLGITKPELLNHDRYGHSTAIDNLTLEARAGIVF